MKVEKKVKAVVKDKASDDFKRQKRTIGQPYPHSAEAHTFQTVSSRKESEDLDTDSSANSSELSEVAELAQPTFDKFNSDLK